MLSVDFYPDEYMFSGKIDSNIFYGKLYYRFSWEIFCNLD